MARKPNDLTSLADLTHEKGTGPVRARRPLYVDMMPPCNHACPAGENIQAWLDLAQAGKYRQAWDVIMRDNPLPAVHGRVCYHPCETECNRAALDGAVGIHAVERFLGDRAAEFTVFVHALFSYRRKMLRKALAQAGYQADALLAATGLEGNRRPEEFTPEQLLALFDKAPRGGAKSGDGL